MKLLAAIVLLLMVGCTLVSVTMQTTIGDNDKVEENRQDTETLEVKP